MIDMIALKLSKLFSFGKIIETNRAILVRMLLFIILEFFDFFNLFLSQTPADKPDFFLQF